MWELRGSQVLHSPAHLPGFRQVSEGLGNRHLASSASASLSAIPSLGVGQHNSLAVREVEVQLAVAMALPAAWRQAPKQGSFFHINAWIDGGKKNKNMSRNMFQKIRHVSDFVLFSAAFGSCAFALQLVEGAEVAESVAGHAEIFGVGDLP